MRAHTRTSSYLGKYFELFKDEPARSRGVIQIAHGGSFFTIGCSLVGRSMVGECDHNPCQGGAEV